MTNSPTKTTCPCGATSSNGKKRALTYAQCCQPHHLGTPAPTALALMRSRYSAYVLGLQDYLMETWHESTRETPSAEDADNDGQDPTIDWLGLTITHNEIIDATHAKVCFIARYRKQGRAHRQIESSWFVREIAPDGVLRWFYVEEDMERK